MTVALALSCRQGANERNHFQSRRAFCAAKAAASIESLLPFFKLSTDSVASELDRSALAEHHSVSGRPHLPLHTAF